jgi:hypothetical protein
MSLHRTVSARTLRVLYRGINKSKRSYHYRSNIVKNENGDLLANSHNILNRWKNSFSQFLNVHRISDVRQIGIYTPELLVPYPSSSQDEVAIAKFNRYKWPGSDQILAELIQAGGDS